MHCYAEKNSKYSQLSRLNKSCWVIFAFKMTSWVKCQTSCQLFFSRSMNVPQTLCLTESLTFITNYKKICFISFNTFSDFLTQKLCLLPQKDSVDRSSTGQRGHEVLLSWAQLRKNAFSSTETEEWKREQMSSSWCIRVEQIINTSGSTFEFCAALLGEVGFTSSSSPVALKTLHKLLLGLPKHFSSY